MRYKSPERMDQIKVFSEKFYQRYYRKPYISEIAEATNLSKSTVHRYLTAMDAEGMIQYDGESIITDAIEKINPAFVNTGICGVIPCGTPTEQNELIEEYVPLPVALFGEGDFFILRASGESMIDAGIHDGDMVVIRRDIEACIYRPDRAHCTAFQCMASADTVHAFRSSVHDDYSGIGIPASVNRASSSSTLSSR